MKGMPMSIRILAATLIAAAVSHHACGLEFSFQSPAQEIVEGFAVNILVVPTNPTFYSCRAGEWSREGSSIRLMLRNNGAMTNSCTSVAFSVGMLEAGIYEVTAVFKDRDGTDLEQGTARLEVLPLEGRCNRDPLVTPAIYGYTALGREVDRVAALNANAGLAQAFPGVTARLVHGTVEVHVPGLQDVPPVLRFLNENYEWTNGWDLAPAGPIRNGHACHPDGGTVYGTFLEFVNPDWGTYFYTADAGEIAAIDSGRMGPWRYTGHSFRAVIEASCPNETGQGVVYRFFGAPNGPRSHFFTRDRAECYVVNKSAAWTFEGVAFWTEPLRPGGTCAPAADKTTRIPLFRIWRPFGESTHRLTTQRAVVDEMTARGWIDEGAVMCVAAPSAS